MINTLLVCVVHTLSTYVVHTLIVYMLLTLRQQCIYLIYIYLIYKNVIFHTDFVCGFNIFYRTTHKICVWFLNAYSIYCSCSLTCASHKMCAWFHYLVNHSHTGSVCGLTV